MGIVLGSKMKVEGAEESKGEEKVRKEQEEEEEYEVMRYCG